MFYDRQYYTTNGLQYNNSSTYFLSVQFCFPITVRNSKTQPQLRHEKISEYKTQNEM